MKQSALFFIIGLLSTFFLISCDRKNEDLVNPISLEEFPKQIILGEEEGGGAEDSDEVEFSLSLTDRFDPTGEELSGKIIPLRSDAVVFFEVHSPEGFENLGDYILGGFAYYEVDDCQTSDDLGIDLGFTLDVTSGQGSVIFPMGVEELLVVFEVSPDYFNNDQIDEERSFAVSLVSVETSENVVANTSLEFVYTVLDDELIFSAWELDLSNPDQLNAFIQFFEGIDGDLSDLALSDVLSVEAEFGLEELEFIVVLVEEEENEECGEVEIVNVEISIEGEYEDITSDDLTGDIEFIVELEDELGFVEELTFSGEFVIVGSQLTLSLENDEGESVELIFAR